MTRNRARQTVEKRPVLRDIVAAVQEQQRRAGPGDFGVDRDAGNVDVFHVPPPLSLRAQRSNLVRARCADASRLLRRLGSSQ